MGCSRSKNKKSSSSKATKSLKRKKSIGKKVGGKAKRGITTRKAQMKKIMEEW